MNTYAVAQVEIRPYPLWTVMMFNQDGIPQGGDHHWLNEASANMALKVYEADASEFGATESRLMKRYEELFS